MLEFSRYTPDSIAAEAQSAERATRAQLAFTSATVILSLDGNSMSQAQHQAKIEAVEEAGWQRDGPSDATAREEAKRSTSAPACDWRGDSPEPELDDLAHPSDDAGKPVQPDEVCDWSGDEPEAEHDALDDIHLPSSKPTPSAAKEDASPQAPPAEGVLPLPTEPLVPTELSNKKETPETKSSGLRSWVPRIPIIKLPSNDKVPGDGKLPSLVPKLPERSPSENSAPPEAPAGGQPREQDQEPTEAPYIPSVPPKIIPRPPIEAHFHEGDKKTGRSKEEKKLAKEGKKKAEKEKKAKKESERRERHRKKKEDEKERKEKKRLEKEAKKKDKGKAAEPATSAEFKPHPACVICNNPEDKNVVEKFIPEYLKEAVSAGGRSSLPTLSSLFDAVRGLLGGKEAEVTQGEHVGPTENPKHHHSLAEHIACHIRDHLNEFLEEAEKGQNTSKGPRHQGLDGNRDSPTPPMFGPVGHTGTSPLASVVPRHIIPGSCSPSYCPPYLRHHGPWFDEAGRNSPCRRSPPSRVYNASYFRSNTVLFNAKSRSLTEPPSMHIYIPSTPVQVFQMGGPYRQYPHTTVPSPSMDFHPDPFDDQLTRGSARTLPPSPPVTGAPSRFGLIRLSPDSPELHDLLTESS
ncbi:hypothetical protein F4778DRAFT_336036 [Xylariomycetidae sp. FL2044]|nr:hypothetical protein F4778DRAFT_336036 [Xylariomycetidae sp. FL2044]